MPHLILKHIDFKDFVDYFLDNDIEEAKKYNEYVEDDGIVIEYYYKNELSPCMLKMCWRLSPNNKWRSMRYNGSSPFAMWWCSLDDEEEESDSEEEED